MSATPTPTASATPTALAGPLCQLVHQRQRRWRCLVAVHALCLMVAGPLLVFWALLVLDNLLHLPMLGRVLAVSVLLLAVLLLVCGQGRHWRRQWAAMSEDHVALAIERYAQGRLQNRLINSLQLQRAAARHQSSNDGDGPVPPLDDGAYLHAVLRENTTALRQSALPTPLPWRDMVWPVALMVLAVSIGAGFCALAPQRFGNAATRVLLPLADVEPIYRTRLQVYPGDVELDPGQDLPIRINVSGEIPRQLTLLTLDDSGQRQQIPLPLAAGQASITHVIAGVQRNLSYRVRGGDFVAPPSGGYRATVLHRPRLVCLTATIQPPAYLNAPPQTVQSRDGQLTALEGSVVEVRFELDRPAQALALNVGDARDAQPPLLLQSSASTMFSGQFVLSKVSSYSLTVDGGGSSHTIGPFGVRVLADQRPAVDLVNLENNGDLDLDAVVNVGVRAQDDWGLREVELVAWRLDGAPAEGQPSVFPSTEPRLLQRWSELSRSLQVEHALAPALLESAEGNWVLLAARAQDHNPQLQPPWSYSRLVAMRIVSQGSDLQLLYDQLRASEAALQNQIAALEPLQRQLTPWLVKLDPSSKLRWDDAATLGQFRTAMNAGAKSAAALRRGVSDSVPRLAAPASTLQISLAMLVDTELARLVRVLDAVGDLEQPQQKRQALVEASSVAQRIGRSLEQILQQHERLRQDWELAHMGPYLRMLGQRQATLAGAAQRHAQAPPTAQHQAALATSAARRQADLVRLCTLAARAFADMSRRVASHQQTLAEGFAAAGQALGDPALAGMLMQAAAELQAGNWSAAAAPQAQAAERLNAIYAALRLTQQQAAQQVLANLQQQGVASVAEQGQIAELAAGVEQVVNGTLADAPQEIIRLVKTAGDDKRHELNTRDWLRPSGTPGEAPLSDASAEKADLPPQPFDQMKLSDAPGNQKSFPNSSDVPANAPGQLSLRDEPYQDVVGALLESADDLRDKYETYNLNAQGQGGAEAGIVGKSAGDMNSFSAAAATGNQKPPTHDYGGAARVGRGGGRAHGLVVGDTMRSMRGMDQAMQGQGKTPFQQGAIREQITDDPQKDFATGFGGRQIDSDEITSFSTKDRGQWDDEIARGLADPKKTHQIVERQGTPIDPKVAEALRDLQSDTEQVIERLKTISKSFKELYLPTEQLDEVMKELAVNLDRLKQRPDAEAFRQQVQTLDRLRSLASVYQQSGSSSEISTRPQTLKGRILDEPPQAALPGYEAALDLYYRELAEP